jgi:diguanylate cyclase (GGDEF)-like protein
MPPLEIYLARRFCLALLVPVLVGAALVLGQGGADRRAGFIALGIVLAGAVFAVATGRGLSRRFAEVNERQTASTQLFHTAINRISQGLCFFDADQRLIICNDRYVEMYKLPLGSITPGMTIQQIVDKRYELGCYPKRSPEEYVAWRREIESSRTVVERTLEMSDGRVFLLHHEPLPQGGWVATHEDITERQVAQARIERMARQDALTGLSNRAFFDEQLRAVLERTSEAQPTALLYVDLDHFKSINDSFGHHVGDGLLRSAAERMKHCVRSTDHVARLGGDEFAVLLPACTAALANMVSQRLVDELSRPFVVEGNSLCIGASIGAAMAYGPEVDVETWLRCADSALYECKNGGRGRFAFKEISGTVGVPAAEALNG